MKVDFIIGNNIILIPKKDRDSEDIEDINSFMEKIGISPKEYLKIRNYIIKDFNSLGISFGIKQKYRNLVTTEINVILQGNHRGFEAIIDDPDEVARFLVGEEAIAIDQNGAEHEVFKESSKVLDWTTYESDYYFFKRLK
jgi:hypothetical protein